MSKYDLLGRIAKALEGLERSEREKRQKVEEEVEKVDEEQVDEEQVVKEFHEIWWSGNLTYGQLGAMRQAKTYLYVDGCQSYGTIKQALDRLQGKVVGFSQAAYNGVHTRSWTVEKTVKRKRKRQWKIL